MSTLVRDVERPALLDRSAEEQLMLGGAVGSRGRQTPSQHGGNIALVEPDPLSDRLRSEQRLDATARAAAPARTGTTRGGAATLDELFVGAWEGLSARHSVTCPVCAGPMQPRSGADGGACADCGAQLR